MIVWVYVAFLAGAIVGSLAALFGMASARGSKR